MQQPLDLINLKREHVKRLANQKGAAGEADVLAAHLHYVARPKGAALDILMAALKESGGAVKRSSFDAIALPEGRVVDFADAAAVRASLPDMVFIEIETPNARIAVGTPIAGRPPHRSVRAQFTHTAPTLGA